MENQVISWMCNLVGYDHRSHGSLLSGGSIANLTGIIAARDHKELKARDFERAVIYLTDETHHCVQKALRLAGMGEAVIRYVPMDEQFSMRPEALDAIINEDLRIGLIPFLLIGSAGTTNTGAIDPLDNLAGIAANHQIWFHVDAAYGGFFLLVEALRSKFKGIEKADSIVMDPHKSLFMPYGSGVILVRNAEHLLSQTTTLRRIYKMIWKGKMNDHLRITPGINQTFPGNAALVFPVYVWNFSLSTSISGKN